MSNKVVATIRLVDGSVHETVLDENIEVAKYEIEQCIQRGDLLKITHPKYGDIFGDDYIVGTQIIAFRLSEDKEFNESHMAVSE